jgi:Fe-Mn family superoxide dismutase
MNTDLDAGEVRRVLQRIDWVSVEREASREIAEALRTCDPILESYVAEPKAYPQVSEYVSQKTKDAHINLYREYVETLNRVSAELDTAPRGEADSKHSTFKSLKVDETSNLNSVWLHELYFAIELERTWGTFDDWQKDFIACALATSNGWAVCGYNMFLKRFVNTVVNAHSHDVMMGLYPVIVVDGWEHAYHKDYLGDKKSYVIAMMRQLNWNVIEERVNKAKEIAQVLGSTNKRNQ